MESPKRKMLKQNDYLRHKLFRKIKRRRKALAELELEAATRLLKRKLKLPKFDTGDDTGRGIVYVDRDRLGVDQDGNVLDAGQPVGDGTIRLPLIMITPLKSGSRYFDGDWSKDFINMVPGIGDAMDVGQVVDDASKGNYLSAGIGAAMLTLPNFIERPLKTIGKKVFPLMLNKINTKHLDNQYDLLFKNLEANGNLMLIEDIMREYSKEGHFRMPVYLDKFDLKNKISPMLLFMSRLTNAGIEFKPDFVYNRSDKHIDYLYNHHITADNVFDGNYSFLENYRRREPYLAVIDPDYIINKENLELTLTHEFAHSLQPLEDDYAGLIALKAFGNTPMSNNYFLNPPHVEFGARGSLLKNALGIYGILRKPLRITPEDYLLVINLYPKRFYDNNISDMANYTSDNELAARFILSASFDSGKDLHIRKVKKSI